MEMINFNYNISHQFKLFFNLRLHLLSILLIIISYCTIFAQHQHQNPLCKGTPCYSNQGLKQQENNSILAMTPFYTGQDCGLSYVRASKKITTRYATPAGSGVPTSLSISGMPPCFQVVKAYVWIIASTSGTPWLTITNPLGSSLSNLAPAANFTGPSKCWGESGTIVTRWDVTSIISGNGNYNVNITNITNPNWAVDGITLMIIYKDPTATFQGNIILADGNNTYAGGTFNYNLNYPAACAAGTNAQAFMMISDMQDNTAPSFPATVNNTGTTFPKSFYDCYTANTTVGSGQSTGNYNVSDGSDCFTVGMLGLYYRTTGCVVCTPPPTLTITSANQAATCSGCNGAGTVTPTGGTAPYSYTWSPSGGNNATATGLCAGNYTVNVKDATGCNTGTVAVTITVAPSYTASISSNSISCFGLCNGNASVSLSGGTLPFSFTWSPSGGNSQSATNLCAGNYSVTIKDGSNCQTTLTVNIAQPSQLLIPSVNITSITCNGLSNGSATVNVSGGAVPYNYTWTPSVSSSSIATGLGAGTYSVQVKDNNNCITNTVITITQPPALSLTATQVQSVSCNGGNNGSANASVSGGMPAYS
ncbi:MAG: SprB repeat-containing protein, partial [Nitrospirota bacterium]